VVGSAKLGRRIGEFARDRAAESGQCPESNVSLIAQNEAEAIDIGDALMEMDRSRE